MAYMINWPIAIVYLVHVNNELLISRLLEAIVIVWRSRVSATVCTVISFQLAFNIAHYLSFEKK